MLELRGIRERAYERERERERERRERGGEERGRIIKGTYSRREHIRERVHQRELITEVAI
jgi:hypothetical protein